MAAPSKYLIYALVDPRDGRWRYVGKSGSGLNRPRAHGRPSVLAKDKTHKANWIKVLISQGLLYDIEILEELSSSRELIPAEMEWIAAARRAGVSLTNMTDGGEGIPGLKMSIELRFRLSAIALRQGRRPSSEAVSRSVRSRAGRPDPRVGRRHTSQAIQRMSASHRRDAAKRMGIPLSAGTRARLAVSRGGGEIVHMETGDVYVSQGSAARALGLSRSHVSEVLHGHRKHASGQHFELKRAA